MRVAAPQGTAALFLSARTDGVRAKFTVRKRTAPDRKAEPPRTVPGSPFQIRPEYARSHSLESHIDGFRRCGTNPSFPAP